MSVHICVCVYIDAHAQEYNGGSEATDWSRFSSFSTESQGFNLALSGSVSTPLHAESPNYFQSFYKNFPLIKIRSLVFAGLIAKLQT